MFELYGDEFESLRLQFATSNRGGTRYVPMAFTEQGVAMLSSVINSEKAIQVNIEIMRAFAQYRSLLTEKKNFREELRAMDGKINKIFRFLLEKIDALSQKKVEQPRRKIGYRIRGEKENFASSSPKHHPRLDNYVLSLLCPIAPIVVKSICDYCDRRFK
jgi:hypothetical protein